MLFALKGCSCVSKFEHGQTQLMGSGANLKRAAGARPRRDQNRILRLPFQTGSGAGERPGSKHAEGDQQTSLDSIGSPR
jgi:hypothetical protein